MKVLVTYTYPHSNKPLNTEPHEVEFDGYDSADVSDDEIHDWLYTDESPGIRFTRGD